ncbi:LOW QUALITY PROTEIN: hypothetical protein TorRG33x02_300640 [Trema orientale]|uniref:Retrovirus-related Pol polyprotein from transposon TNT 1-94-like beta-barrel domain-containing protein n=1 Tax=Trema orientale TaxID=63057 RepID=A0A2P5C216_TREOI|nr:LOW QUALITY PROTEIN: hypothetical protein TorRG33x02_300640 [Trema orientale]
MCLIRDWFVDYQSVDRDSVFLENNISCKVVGVGLFELRCMTVLLELNVRHVPDLRKSLTSLGTLDSQGYKYSAEGGVLSVSKDAHVVIKRKLHNGLYFLHGSIVDSATMASSCFVLDFDTMSLLDGQKIREFDFYNCYVYGTRYLVKFGSTVCRNKDTMDCIHSEFSGLSPNLSVDGSCYF